MRKFVIAGLALAGFVSASTVTYAQQRNCVTQKVGNTYYTRCY